MNLNAQIHVLTDLKKLLENLNPTSFTRKNSSLFGSTIGEHFRHIIEFYICCFEQKDSGVINYDLRQRDPSLENNIALGILEINKISELIKQAENNKNVNLIFDNCLNESVNKNGSQTSFYRELSYCMDHCIHHQSLIKIALLEQGLHHLIDKNFGVAFSTQKHRQECAS